VLFTVIEAHDGYVTLTILPIEGLLDATVMLYPDIPFAAVSSLIVYVVVEPTETVAVPGRNERVGDDDGVGVGVTVGVTVGTVVGVTVGVGVGVGVTVM
jgi:MFS superfamily sulfate permease-like transporter